MFDKEFIKDMKSMLPRLITGVVSEMPQLMETFVQKTFVNSETEVHPRVLTEWGKKGLLISTYEKSRHNRLTVTEFVWIKLVEQMREFNFSYDFILNVKKELVQPVGDSLLNPLFNEEVQTSLMENLEPSTRLLFKTIFQNKDSFKELLRSIGIDLDVITSFDILLILCLVYQTPFTINLDKDGVGALFSPLYLEFIDQEKYIRQMQQTHVTLSVSEVLAKALSIAPIEKVGNQLKLISKEEAEVLEALDQPNLRSVVIRFDDKNEMNLLEVTTEERVDRRTRLLEIIMTNGYQDIEVTTVKGRIVKCRNTKKIKLK